MTRQLSAFRTGTLRDVPGSSPPPGNSPRPARLRGPRVSAARTSTARVGHAGRLLIAWPFARALPQLVAAACQVRGLGGVARHLDGFVVRRARLLTAAQPA